MNKFLYFFNKKYLFILAGLFLVSSLALEPLHHNEYEIEHSEAECHYCINETLDDFLVDVSIENLFLSIYFNSILLTPGFIDTRLLIATDSREGGYTKCDTGATTISAGVFV